MADFSVPTSSPSSTPSSIPSKRASWFKWNPSSPRSPSSTSAASATSGARSSPLVSKLRIRQKTAQRRESFTSAASSFDEDQEEEDMGSFNILNLLPFVTQRLGAWEATLDSLKGFWEKLRYLDIDSQVVYKEALETLSSPSTGDRGGRIKTPGGVGGGGGGGDKGGFLSFFTPGPPTPPTLSRASSSSHNCRASTITNSSSSAAAAEGSTSGGGGLAGESSSSSSNDAPFYEKVQLCEPAASHLAPERHLPHLLQTMLGHASCKAYQHEISVLIETRIIDGISQLIELTAAAKKEIISGTLKSHSNKSFKKHHETVQQLEEQLGTILEKRHGGDENGPSSSSPRDRLEILENNKTHTSNDPWLIRHHILSLKAAYVIHYRQELETAYLAQRQLNVFETRATQTLYALFRDYMDNESKVAEMHAATLDHMVDGLGQVQQSQLPTLLPMLLPSTFIPVMFPTAGGGEGGGMGSLGEAIPIFPPTIPASSTLPSMLYGGGPDGDDQAAAALKIVYSGSLFKRTSSFFGARHAWTPLICVVTAGGWIHAFESTSVIIASSRDQLGGGGGQSSDALGEERGSGAVVGAGESSSSDIAPVGASAISVESESSLLRRVVLEPPEGSGYIAHTIQHTKSFTAATSTTTMFVSGEPKLSIPLGDCTLEGTSKLAVEDLNEFEVLQRSPVVSKSVTSHLFRASGPESRREWIRVISSFTSTVTSASGGDDGDGDAEVPSVHRTDPPKLTAVAPAALATASASSSSSSSDTSDADRQPPGYSKNGISTLQIGSAKTVAESSLLLQEAEAVIASKGLATEDQAASSSDDHD